MSNRLKLIALLAASLLTAHVAHSAQERCRPVQKLPTAIVKTADLDDFQVRKDSSGRVIRPEARRILKGPVSIKPGHSLEEILMFKNGASRLSGQLRFADGNSSWIYRFNFRDPERAEITLDLDNQFLVEASGAGWKYHVVADSNTEGKKCAPRTTVRIPVRKLHENGELYLRLSDRVKTNGWGGRLHQMTVKGTLDLTPAEIIPADRANLHENAELFPSSKPLPELIYVFPLVSLPKSEAMLLVSLQGVVAQKQPRIFLSGSGTDYWLDEFKKHGSVIKNVKNWQSLLKKFSGELNGYVLCDDDTWDLATTMSGIHSSLMVHESLEGLVSGFGLSKVMDVRGKDLKWFYNYLKGAGKGKYSQKGIVNIEDHGVVMRDFAIANKMIYVHSKNNAQVLEKFYYLIAEGAIRYGWNDPFSGEFGDVNFAGERGLATIPTDWTRNLTMHAARPAGMSFTHVGNAPDVSAKKVHTVTLVMSDGDNLNWILGGFNRKSSNGTGKYFSNRNRGNFPMGWMIPTCMADLTPLAYRYLRSLRSEKDLFMGAITGPGYVYPSNMPNMDSYLKRIDEYARRCGLKYTLFMDNADFQTTERNVVSRLLTKDSYLEGMIYIDYSAYNKWKGDLFFSNGKPVVSCRYRLWENNMSPDECIEKLVTAKRDPHSKEGYSAIVCHAWSYDMNDLAEFARKLPSGVELVRPDTFLERIRANCPQ